MKTLEIGVERAQVLARRLRAVRQAQTLLDEQKALLRAACEVAFAGIEAEGVVVEVNEVNGTVRIEEAEET